MQLKPKWIAFLLLAGCHKGNAEEPAHPSIDLVEVEDRAASMTSPPGWIACVNADGSPGCLGDSLLFTGLAMGAADCDHGAPYQTALVEMIHDNNGTLERHPTIRGSSLDGALGFLWGMARRYAHCPESQEQILAAVRLYDSHAAGTLEPYFPVVIRQVLADMGDGDPPSEHDRGLLGAEIAGWALATVVTESAAYRLHLGYLALSLVGAPKGRASYCGAVEKAEIPLVEHFCGRAGLSQWLDSFQFDVQEYRHQRAAWESEDPAGKRFPGVDYLVGYYEANH